MDIAPEPGEEQASAGDAVVLAERETYLEPSYWPQLFGGSQPIFPGASFCGFTVVYDQTGCLTIRLVLEGPDGIRETVEVGPLPIASMMYLASYALMDAYGQMLAYLQVPYQGGVASETAENHPEPAQLP